MKVPWTEHKTNEEILKMVETERKLMGTVRSRQKRWLGHILRHDSLLRITLEGQIKGKKAYRRPSTMLLDWLLKTQEGNISYKELKMSAQDTSRWINEDGNLPYGRALQRERETISHTHCWVVVPVQHLVLPVAFAVVRVTQNCVECKIETVTFCVQLISRHAGQSKPICLVQRQQWCRQFADKVVFLIRLTRQTNILVHFC